MGGRYRKVGAYSWFGLGPGVHRNGGGCGGDRRLRRPGGPFWREGVRDRPDVHIRSSPGRRRNPRVSLRLRELPPRYPGRPAPAWTGTTWEFGCLLFVYCASGLIAILPNALIGFGTGGSISADSFGWAVAVGVSFVPGAALARKAVLITPDLGINALIYASPVVGLLWLGLFTDITVARLDLLVVGAVIVAMANVVVEQTLGSLLQKARQGEAPRRARLRDRASVGRRSIRNGTWRGPHTWSMAKRLQRFEGVDHSTSTPVTAAWRGPTQSASANSSKPARLPSGHHQDGAVPLVGDPSHQLQAPGQFVHPPAKSHSLHPSPDHRPQMGPVG